jgi:glycosyltransferase involved in cell wall biosynthesis
MTHIEVSDPARLVAAPTISVLMLAYNHGQWIGEAIASVLAQRTGEPFELIVGEDCSTDDTRAIALDWQRRHPDRIRVVYPETNAGMAANFRRLVDAARGEFLAYCEGDDYWCHPAKLDAQAALLRAEPRAAIVHADWVRAKPMEGAWHVDPDRTAHARMDPRFLSGDLFPVFYLPRLLRTCTVMHRRDAVRAFFDSPLGAARLRFVDTALSAFLTSRWRTQYWPEVAAVYREAPNSALRSGRRSFLGFLRSALAFDTVARAYFVERPDYPTAYRWECAIGLLLRAMRLGDRDAMREALADLRAHYGLASFVSAGWTALRLRWPHHG